MIDPVTEWFEVTQYSNKKAVMIANLVENMWLIWYPWPVEVMYDLGGKLLGHEFKNILIENEYSINTNPDYPGKPQANKSI